MRKSEVSALRAAICSRNGQLVSVTKSSVMEAVLVSAIYSDRGVLMLFSNKVCLVTLHFFIYFFFITMFVILICIVMLYLEERYCCENLYPDSIAMT